MYEPGKTKRPENADTSVKVIDLILIFKILILLGIKCNWFNKFYRLTSGLLPIIVLFSMPNAETF